MAVEITAIIPYWHMYKDFNDGRAGNDGLFGRLATTSSLAGLATTNYGERLVTPSVEPASTNLMNGDGKSPQRWGWR